MFHKHAYFVFKTGLLRNAQNIGIYIMMEHYFFG